MRGSRLKLWKTKPIRSLRMPASASGLSADTSTPSKWYSPAVGVSRQPSRFMNVDLPEPDGPMTATNSPASIVAVMPLSACTVSGPTR